MFEICATDAAERDLVEIRGYLVGKLCNPQAWENLVGKIRLAYETLQEQPYGFVECRDEHLRRKAYRKCSLGAYLFFYRVDEANSKVHIVRFFHGLQDYESML